MLFKLLVGSLACASAATLAPRPALAKSLALRGGGQLGSIDEKAMLLIQAFGAGSFGSEFILSKWASTRYWDEPNPTSGWKQLSEAFGIGLLLTAVQAYNIANSGDAALVSSYGKTFTFAWVAWTLMHVKWHQEGSLIGSGKYKGQVGGGAACAAICALSLYTHYL